MSGDAATRLLAWYGDDFTGSTDVLEALASRGVRTVLFLGQPDPDFFARFKDCEAFGVAGSSRSQTPDWMDAHLPSAFRWLRHLNTPLVHYKVCSTFDSSPEIGNIGRAIEIGRQVFHASCVPVLVGAPSLRRYVVFGNLFATADGHTWRIDHHPTMSRHPVTPMHEADLALHLAQQTGLAVRSFNILDLRSDDVSQQFEAKAAVADVLIVDTLDNSSLLAAGRLLWDGRARRPFLTGSSGVEYALTEWWRATGVISQPSAELSAYAADRLLVVSGSCSPVTARQIAVAGQNGFVLIRLDAQALTGGDIGEAAASAAINRATEALAEGRSVVLYSAAGPADMVPVSGSTTAGLEFRHQLAGQTGRILSAILDRCRVQRVVVAGGDTSSHVGKQLEIEALTYLAPIAPGAPLCRAWSRKTGRDGLEVVFKGGQVGTDDFFLRVKQGR